MNVNRNICYPKSFYIVSCIFFLASSACHVPTIRTRGCQVSSPEHTLVCLDVPFIRQTKDRDCGPTSLSILLRTYGYAFREPSLWTIYDRGLGTLPVQIERWLKAKKIPYEKVDPEPQELIQHLKKGTPIIVLLRLSRGPLRLFHYVVIVGVELIHNAPFQWFIHNGTRAYYPVSAETFLQQWKRAHSWGIVLKRSHVQKATQYE